jgi:hypothetical protein
MAVLAHCDQRLAKKPPVSCHSAARDGMVSLVRQLPVGSERLILDEMADYRGAESAFNHGTFVRIA